MPTFSDLARAAYCPRQLYYARRDDSRGPDERAKRRRGLAFRYPALLDAPPERLAALPLDLDPPAYRARLRALADRDDWTEIAEPDARNRALDGKDCHGVAHKLVEAPPVPTVVSPGRPPERGVWAPQRVRAVATALALAWEREGPVERCRVEYPASAVVRHVRLTGGNRRLYRRTLRTVRRMERETPPRTDDHAKCGSCAYREDCRGKTRSLRSRIFRSS
ncbi:MAG: Dna2/Cas4 domain-containing protein [Haloferacaceae archaeon]